MALATDKRVLLLAEVALDVGAVLHLVFLSTAEQTAVDPARRTLDRNLVLCLLLRGRIVALLARNAIASCRATTTALLQAPRQPAFALIVVVLRLDRLAVLDAIADATVAALYARLAD